MLVTLVLLVFGVMLFDMRGRLKAAEHRLALLEGGIGDAPFPARYRRADGDGDDDAGVKTAAPASVVERRVAMDTAPPHPMPAVVIDRRSSEGGTHSPARSASDEVREIDAPFPPDDGEKAEGIDMAVERPARPSFSFEDLFGRRLPIWAGGVTLAVAGVLLVKYSIDAGLLAPLVRVVLGLLFGGALIGGAEAALRLEDRVRDARVRQALAGAGLATLYAAILAAHMLYGLVGPGIAFAGLAGVTGLAMALSLRFGAPSALLGLVGGLAAPALVEAGQPNVPLLSCYLALAVGGLCVLSRTQRWMWLGVSALVGGAGWGVVMLAMGALDWASSLSVGLLVLMLGMALPVLAFSGTRAALLRMGAAVAAAGQMAALVATGGFGLLQWGLFGLLSLMLVWLGRDAALRPLAAIGAGVALLLAAVWPQPEMGHFALVMLGMVAIYGGAALLRVWRGALIEAGQIAGLALGGFAVALGQCWRVGLDGEFALLALAAAGLPGAAMAMGWRCGTRREDARFVTLASAAALLLVVAGGLGLPEWSLAMVIAAVAAALLRLAALAEDRRVEWSGWGFAFGALVVLAGSDDVVRLWGEAADEPGWQGVMRWAAGAAMAALFAWRARFAEGRMVAQGVAVLLAYGAVAQTVPALWVPVGLALGLAMLAEGARRLAVGRMAPALGVALALVALWAAWPLGIWLGRVLLSLVGEPVLVRDLPGIGEVARRIALPAMALGLALWRGGSAVDAVGRRIGCCVAAVLGGVAAHVAFKQLFALGSLAEVTRLALAERTLWEAVLMGLGFVALRGRIALARFHPLRKAGENVERAVGTCLIAAGLGHLLVYSVVLHNPLWFPQAVGRWPLLNLLPVVLALAFVALKVADGWSRRMADGVRMALIALFGVALLRQLFVGSLLTVRGVGQVEDILRSVLALALAIGFLLWGIRGQAQAANARDWRIASLLLMLFAVAKVFLFDASGLTGLLRIASFLALGFSLIGIGWLYNRLLREPVNNSATIAA
ncbi:DUF2339 domain-containing protein [Sphingobium sp. SA916]|uniref:DUF2339 domain-containing protein n=1 Tax=Sphingobium sp. SA916 TaxID=1851207 RepID=UPI000C9FA31D|nr:DUF2339 domain-containing protein [Sphingobium sp. SA916]PNQ01733.1 hypothetical protein A8G00_16225 [Sphingobium sp. SA916]